MGGKKRHFQTLHIESGIPYNEMVFFDDWDLNVREVSQLGVLGIYNPNGLNEEKFHQGLSRYKSKVIEREEAGVEDAEYKNRPNQNGEEKEMNTSKKNGNGKGSRKRRG